MKKEFKKMLIASISCITIAGFSMMAATEAAGYKLNDEVKNPTPALIQASEIGLRSYTTTNPMLLKQENKDAILVMSFGTTYPDTRLKTIDATVNEIQKSHPNTKVVLAFTSHIIIDRIKENEGLTIPTPEEALEQLKKEGYNRVALVTLDIIPGMEYAYKEAVYDIYKKDFKKMTLGTPLLYWMGQEDQRDDVEEAVEALKAQLPQKMSSDSAVVIMAHGTPDPTNAYYSVIQDRLHRVFGEKAFIYTVEGWPNLEDIIPKLQKEKVKTIYLMPFMMVSGDHANNDMAGDEEDSHKTILEKEGFKVVPYLHGLGENKEIRKMFVDHANEAYNALLEK